MADFDTTKKWEKVTVVPAPRGVVRDTPVDVGSLLSAAERGEDVASLIGRSVSAEDLLRIQKKSGRKLVSTDDEYRRLGVPPTLAPSKERNEYRYRKGNEIVQITPPKEVDLRRMFEGTPNVVFLPSVARDRLDPRFEKQNPGQKFTPNFVTNMLTQVSYGKAMDVAMRVVALPYEHFSAAEVGQAWEWARRAMDYHVQSGPLMGMYHRLIASVGQAKPNKVDWVSRKDAILALLPYDSSRAQMMAGRELRDLKVELNLKSGSGLPFQKPKHEVLRESYELAAEVLAAVHSGKLKELMQTRQELFIAQVKNKLDLYVYEETRESVRAYFVFPFHLVWLFSAVWQNVARCMRTFEEDRSCFNMHGFRWQRGGAQRLYEWLVSVSETPGLHGKAYSDDNLWVLVVRVGGELVCYVLCVDYKRMDLSLHTDHGKLGQWYALEVLRKALDETWKRVTALSCQMAFQTVVAVGYALIVLMQHNLKSGVPGTPEFDQLASADAFVVFREALSAQLPQWEVSNLGRLQHALDEAALAVKTRTGLLVKRETLKMIRFVPDQESYPEITFLGKYLAAVPNLRPRVYIPASDPARALASAVSPKSGLRGNALIMAQMTRVRDICVAGAFVHRQLYYGLSAWFRTMAKLGNRAKPTLEDTDADFEADPHGAPSPHYTGPDDYFPALEEIYQIYLPPGQEWRPRVAAVGVAVVPELQVLSPERVAELYGDPDNWANIEELRSTDRPAEIEKRGPLEVFRPSPVEAAQAGRLLPLSAEQKAAYVEAWRAKLGRIRGTRWEQEPSARSLKMRDKKLAYIAGFLAAQESRYQREEAFDADEQPEVPEPSYEIEEQADVWEEAEVDAFEDAVRAEGRRLRIPTSKWTTRVDRGDGRLVVGESG